MLNAVVLRSERSRGSIREVIGGILLAAIIATPIALGFVSSDQGGERRIYVCATIWAISGMFAWRAGAAVAAAATVVVAVATSILAQTQSSHVLYDFIAVLIVTAMSALFNPTIFVKLGAVLVVGLLSAIVDHAFQPFLIVVGAGVSAAGIAHLVNVVRYETSRVFRPLRGKWGPIIAYLSLACGTIIVFALWYRFAYFCLPDNAFGALPPAEIAKLSDWSVSLPIFLYEALLTFATEGPPFPPTNPYTRGLVSLEVFCSVLLFGIYLNLLANSIGNKETGR